MSRNMVMNGVPKSAYIRPICIRSMGSPKWGDPYGDGAPVVVCDGESPLHTTCTTSFAGDGEQVCRVSILLVRNSVMRIAYKYIQAVHIF